MPLRRHLLAAAVAATLTGGPALAAFPEKSITIVVPTAAGGANDAMARTIGQGLSTALKQPVIVENKAGAGGALAAEFVAKAAPDGYTLMLGYIATHAMNPALQKLRYDPVKDFEAVGLVGYSPVLMVTNPGVKAANAKELVALLKGAPDKYSYASAGNGTAPHFSAEIFKLESGAQMAHVPYRGAAPAMTDLLGGQVDMMFATAAAAAPQIAGGKLRALAVTSTERSPAMKSVPTIAETVPGYAVESWYGLYAPAGTPPDVIAKLNAAAKKAAHSPEFSKKIEHEGLAVVASEPAEFDRYVKAEEARWRKIVKENNIKPD